MLQITRDFEKLQPGKSVLLSNRWAVVRTCLNNYWRGGNCKIPAEDRGLVSSLETLPPRQQTSILLYLLPSIIPQRRSAPKRKPKDSETVDVIKPKKFSLQERRNSFILHVTNARSLDSELENHKEALRKQGSSLQPLIVVVGPLAAPQQYFVVINNLKYQCETVLDAVQTAFQSFFVIDLNYPAAAETIWLFFQVAVFGISLETDRPIDAINILKTQIENRCQLLQRSLDQQPDPQPESQS